MPPTSAESAETRNSRINLQKSMREFAQGTPPSTAQKRRATQAPHLWYSIHPALNLQQYGQPESLPIGHLDVHFNLYRGNVGRDWWL